MLKPLHAGWVVEFYNEVSSAKGEKKSSELGVEQLELQMQFALGANHPSIRLMILKGRSGTCMWKKMMKATNLIASSITENLLMHLKKTWTYISELFKYFIVFEVKKKKCRTFANEHSV